MTYNEERQKLNDLQAEYRALETRMVELRAEMSAKHEQIMQQRLVCTNMLDSTGARYSEKQYLYEKRVQTQIPGGRSA